MAAGSPLYAPIAAASNGDNTLITGTAGYRIVVLGYVLLSSGTVTATFYDGPSSGAIKLSGGFQLAAQAGMTCPVCNFTENAQAGWMQAASGNNLILKLSGATEVDGHITYCLTAA